MHPTKLVSIGDHLRKRRMDLGITQKAAASQIGADQYTMINWEKDRTQVAIRFVPAIIRFLGYDPFPKGQTLGERLRAARRTQGLSYTAMAQELDVDSSTVLNWERGRHNPPVKYCPRILKMIGPEVLPPDASLRDCLCTYWRANGLTQAKLGTLLGISQNVVSVWERNVRQPETMGLEFVQRLRDLLRS